MKRKTILIILFLILFICCILFILLLFKLKFSENADFTLIKEEDFVYYKLDEDAVYSKLEEEEIVLPSSSFVKTKEGIAYIIFPDNSLVSIDEYTELQINFESEKINIKQLIGSTWHRINDITTKKEYEVETPTTFASVRGTKFAVDVNSKGTSEIFALENDVYVSQYIIKQNIKKQVNPKIIKPGEYTQIKDYQSQKKFEINPISKEKRNIMWYKLNEEFDKKYDQNVNKFKQRILIDKIREDDEIRKLLTERRERSMILKNHLSDEQFEVVKQYLELSKLQTENEYASKYICDYIQSEEFEQILNELDKIPSEYRTQRYLTTYNTLTELKEICNQ
ncbi:hypothetical protein GF362_02990 [Candidatus Dojkabacteria bacterium]|nr:hypothetical protein [Candidatus Dojkabacteria bacterium]